MAERKLSISEDDSFIILGTSPGSSLDLQCNGEENGSSLDKTQLDDALKDLSPEASVAFKAHFQLGDSVSRAFSFFLYYLWKSHEKVLVHHIRQMCQDNTLDRLIGIDGFLFCFPQLDKACSKFYDLSLFLFDKF